MKAFTAPCNDAYVQLYREWYDAALRMARRHTEDHFLAEDLVQDIFLRMLENKSGLEGIENFQQYLFVAIKNRFNDHLRRKQQHPSFSLDVLEQWADETCNVADKIDVSRGIQHAMRVLPPRQREALYLKMHGIGAKEIYAHLKLKPSAGQSLLRDMRLSCLKHIGYLRSA